jgi:hypothetical protein
VHSPHLCRGNLQFAPATNIAASFELPRSPLGDALLKNANAGCPAVKRTKNGTKADLKRTKKGEGRSTGPTARRRGGNLSYPLHTVEPVHVSLRSETGF